MKGVRITDPKYQSVFIFSRMITFISSKVSDLPFYIEVKSKNNCLRHVMQTFPFLFIILLLFIFFDFIFLQYNSMF